LGEGGGGADTDAACPVLPVPADMPSQTSIDFVLTNASSTDRYVITSGDGCDAPAIENVATLAPLACKCECRTPRVYIAFTRIASGASLTLSWDARRAVPYDQSLDCSFFGRKCSSFSAAAFRPVDPGAFTAKFGVATTLPTINYLRHCTGSVDAFQCDVVGGTAPACDGSPIGLTTTIITQPFAVPASGSATIRVTLP
jgi:hypothetical protein